MREPRARYVPLIRSGGAALFACAVLGSARPAAADPQWSGGATVAVCHVRDTHDSIEGLRFCGNVHGDLLFLRQRNADFGLGPYVEVGTAAFDDLRLSAGASLLLPISDDFPLVASAGFLSRQFSDPGVEASLFWGLRSFNYHSAYNLAGGIVLGAQQSFGAGHNRVLSIGLRIDGLLFALPFLLLQGAVE